MVKLFRLRGTKLFLLGMDWMMIVLSFLLTFKFLFLHAGFLGDHFDLFLQHVTRLSGLMIVTYWFFDLYNLSGRREFAKSIYSMIICHVIIAVELMMINHLFQLFTLSVIEVMCVCGLQLLFMLGLRSLLFWIQYKGIGKKKAMIIAKNAETARTIIEQMMNSGRNRFEVSGILLTSNWSKEMLESSLEHIDLFLLSHDLAPDLKAEVIRFVGNRRIEVLVVPDFYELFLAGAEMQQIDDLLVYSIMPPELSSFEKMMKRTLDLTVSLLLLAFTSPVMLFMLFWIPRNSGGKAIYKQERIGLSGKPFMVLKFRTMVDNAEKISGPVLAAEYDPRITRVGRFLRSTRMDELPQLLNVMKGELSLVGPRPEREFFINEFKKHIPHYTYRLMVKPGLTGLAQVRGKYSTSSSDKLRYDLMYIKNYSPLQDLKILFQTILVVMQREQSKGVSTAARVTENLLFHAIHEVAGNQGTAIPSFSRLAGKSSHR